MSNYTKEQIQSGTLSAQDLLNSFSIGNNAATKEPSLRQGIHNGALQGKPISIALLTAFTEFQCSKNPDFIAALHDGFIVPRHKMQYDKAVKAIKQPLEGHYLTSEEWLESCYSLLPELPTPTFEDVLSALASYKPSMNKTELVTLVESLISLCTPKGYTLSDLTQEQLDKYIDLQSKEIALSGAVNALSFYLTDIKPISDNTLVGKYAPESNQWGELLALSKQENYIVLPPKTIPAKMDDSFNIVESGYILFSVKVI